MSLACVGLVLVRLVLMKVLVPVAVAGGGCSGCLGLEKGGGAFAGAEPGLMPAGSGITGTAPGFGGGAAEGGFAIPGLTRGCGRRALGFAGDPVLFAGARAGSGAIFWPGAGFASDPILFAGGRAGPGGICWPGGGFAGDPYLFAGARAGFGGICWPGAAFAGDPVLSAGGRAGSGGRCWPGAACAVPSEKGWDMPVLGGPMFNGSGRLMGGVMFSHLPFTFTQ